MVEHYFPIILQKNVLIIIDLLLVFRETYDTVYIAM